MPLFSRFAPMILRGVPLAFGLGPVAARAEPQEPTVVLAAAGCENCRLLLDSVAYLGHPDDKVAVTGILPPAHDSKGNYYAMPDGARDGVLVFGPDGRLQTHFGRSGQGPGEFSSMVTGIVMAPGDTLYEFERSRVHVFSPDHSFVRQYTVGRSGTASNAAAVFPDGRFAISSGPHQFTLYHPDGTGAAPAPIALQGADTLLCAQCGERQFRAGREPATVWSAPANEYAIEQHDLSGRLRLRLSRQVPWFQKWYPSTARDMEQRMRDQVAQSRFTGLEVDHRGLVWTHVIAQDAAEPIPASINLDPRDPQARMDFMLKHLASYVEVIDPGRRFVVASLKLKGFYFPVAAGLIAEMVQDPVVGNVWKVYRVTLVTPT